MFLPAPCQRLRMSTPWLLPTGPVQAIRSTFLFSAFMALKGQAQVSAWVQPKSRAGALQTPIWISSYPCFFTAAETVTGFGGDSMGFMYFTNAGTATTATMDRVATTIMSSINVNPRELFILHLLSFVGGRVFSLEQVTRNDDGYNEDNQWAVSRRRNGKTGDCHGHQPHHGSEDGKNHRSGDR